MQANLQDQIAFHLTGRINGPHLRPVDANHRPALLAGFTDLHTLRYDFPLVLNRIGTPDRAILSLSEMVDDAVASIEGENVDLVRVARHGYRLEREIRKELSTRGSADFAELWNESVAKLASDDQTLIDSANRLWTAFRTSGEIVDVDARLSELVLRHAWERTQNVKACVFRERAERLLFKLRNILEAEAAGTPVGRSPERLMAAVGPSFASSFDFDALSRLLVESKPSSGLSEERRTRIRSVIEVLERQRFYSLESEGPEPYLFSFSNSLDALNAYHERHPEALGLLKALAIAELETRGEYRESVHNPLFETYGINGLSGDEWAHLPDYLVCIDPETLDPEETARLLEMLASGIRVKILIRTDDLFERSEITEGRLILGLRSRQVVQTAIALSDVFVLQVSASQLYQKREALFKGLTFEGAALFNVFSGSHGYAGGTPAYLVAAAATESRAFPALVYDPSGGTDWADRFVISDNPFPQEDWPVHSIGYEDCALQAREEEITFTLADFMAMDERFSDRFALADRSDWVDEMVPISKALDRDVNGMPSEVPFVFLIDDQNGLKRAVTDQRTLLETRRCLTMWRSLQELGGIHNSYAERLLAATSSKFAAVASPSETTPVETQPLPKVVDQATEPTADPATSNGSSGDPYIETARCTSCNECTNLNNRMFAYNAEKQAYIADPDAGTFRQLVEAAEGCQVSIIHPGKPRNPKEPGLEDLIKRAAEFN